jgi:hypothetical protein
VPSGMDQIEGLNRLSSRGCLPVFCRVSLIAHLHFKVLRRPVDPKDTRGHEELRNRVQEDTGGTDGIREDTTYTGFGTVRHLAT